MKRYWSFMGNIYYPQGGMGDFQGDFDSLKEAVENLENILRTKYRSKEWTYMWAQVYDTQKRETVWSKYKPR